MGFKIDCDFKFSFGSLGAGCVAPMPLGGVGFEVVIFSGVLLFSLCGCGAPIPLKVVTWVLFGNQW